MPRITRAFSAPNQHFSMSTILTKSCPPKYFLRSFHASGQILRPRTSSRHLHVLVSPSTPHTSILIGLHTPLRSMLRLLSFLVHSVSTFLLALAWAFFAVFPFLHQGGKAGCVLQGCVHLFSLLLHCLCSRFRHKIFVQHCSFFCQLIRFFVAFSDKLLKVRHIFTIFVCAKCLDMRHFHHNISCDKTVQFFPNFDPQVCIVCFRVYASSFSPPQPVKNFLCCRHAPRWVQ